MRALKFITGHVIFKLFNNQIYQLKTTKLAYGHAFSTCLLQIDVRRAELEDINHFYTDLSKGFLNTQIETLTPHMVKLNDLTEFIEGRNSSRMSYEMAAILNRNIAYIPHILNDSNGRFGDKRE